MKKLASIILALLLLSAFLTASAAANVEGFVFAAGHDNYFAVNSDKSVTILSTGNPSMTFATDTKGKDYTFDVYVMLPKQPEGGTAKDLALVIAVATKDKVWPNNGITFKLHLQNSSTPHCSIYNWGYEEGPDRRPPLVDGITVADLNIDLEGYNKVTVEKKGDLYNFYVNDILAFENIPTLSNGTEITLGGNFSDTTNTQTTFKAFTYTEEGKEPVTYLTDGKEVPEYPSTLSEETSSETTSSEAASSEAASSEAASSQAASSQSTSSKASSGDDMDMTVFIIGGVCVVVIALAAAVAFILIRKSKKKNG